MKKSKWLTARFHHFLPGAGADTNSDVLLSPLEGSSWSGRSCRKPASHSRSAGHDAPLATACSRPEALPSLRPCAAAGSRSTWQGESGAQHFRSGASVAPGSRGRGEARENGWRRSPQGESREAVAGGGREGRSLGTVTSTGRGASGRAWTRRQTHIGCLSFQVAYRRCAIFLPRRVMSRC
jgi:hypothetical protein